MAVTTVQTIGTATAGAEEAAEITATAVMIALEGSITITGEVMAVAAVGDLDRGVSVHLAAEVEVVIEVIVATVAGPPSQEVEATVGLLAGAEAAVVVLTMVLVSQGA
eukprot:402463_1